MVNHVADTFPETADEEIVSPSAPVLKRVNCVYVPASDPYLTIQWFGRFFGMRRQKPVKRDTSGESLELGNGMELYILKAEPGSRMTFQTDVWSGPEFQMSMLSFEVDDIWSVHRSLREGGARVEELRDSGGCGMGFYFYDPDGNKFCAWELQTLIRRHKDEAHANNPNWKKRFGFDNCYFNGDVDAFLNIASAGSRGSTRRLQIVGHAALRETDPEGLQSLVDALDLFNREHPDRSFRIVYREH